MEAAEVLPRSARGACSIGIIEPTATPQMLLSDDIFDGFKQSRLIGKDLEPTDMVYSTDGLLLGACNSSMLKLFSATTGQVQNIIHIGNMSNFEFIYPNALVHSRLCGLYYLSVYDNQYIRSFNGHRSNIRAISVSPGSDALMSSSAECTNYWDIRKKNPTLRIEAMNGLGALSSSYDFAVTVSDVLLKLYDRRNTRGPRTTVRLPMKDYSGIAYSPDGSCIIASSDRSHFIFDSEGSLRSSINLERPSRGCFSPDSNYFICCSGDFVFVYRLRDRKRLCTFQSAGFSNTVVRFNPRYAQIAAASSSVNLWALAG
jgi:COMPASS component SWD2